MADRTPDIQEIIRNEQAEDLAHRAFFMGQLTATLRKDGFVVVEAIPKDGTLTLKAGERKYRLTVDQIEGGSG